MARQDFSDLSVDQVRQYIDLHKESDFALIDVRQPEEYEAAHIPGGLLFPLSDFEEALDALPEDKELIVYCRSGNRSRVASTFIVQSGKFHHSVYNMAGGILAWDGGTVQDFPRFKIFDLEAGPAELLRTAMDLEKGAARFYTEAADRAKGGPISEAFARLARDEQAHAKVLYKIWADDREQAETFEDLFASLKGEYVEGGEPLADMVARLEEIQGGFCLNAAELALNLEYTAFDLYRNVAEMEKDNPAGKILLDLAQAEKQHMRRVMKVLSACEVI